MEAALLSMASCFFAAVFIHFLRLVAAVLPVMLFHMVPVLVHAAGLFLLPKVHMQTGGFGLTVQGKKRHTGYNGIFHHIFHGLCIVFCTGLHAPYTNQAHQKRVFVYFFKFFFINKSEKDDAISAFR